MKIPFYKSPVLHGYVASNLFALLVLGLTSVISAREDSTLVFSEFVILPIVMGIIASWFWRNLEPKGGYLTINAVLNSMLAIALSYIFLGEGIICLIIVSPLIITFMITGTFIGKSMFKKNNQTLNVSVFSLLLVFFIADSLSNHHYENVVADEIVIQARPEEVWKHVVAFERIEQKNEFWLFQIGMPSPMQTTVTGNHLGAGRKCIFSNGYVFDEKIVTYKPEENLTFDITHQPQDPEIMGHIDILRGQFLLKDNGNGTTTLTGNSWYNLHVFPTWYYDIWAKSITRNVHLRVMDHIRELSEKS